MAPTGVKLPSVENPDYTTNLQIPAEIIIAVNTSSWGVNFVFILFNFLSGLKYEIFGELLETEIPRNDTYLKAIDLCACSCKTNDPAIVGIITCIGSVQIISGRINS